MKRPSGFQAEPPEEPAPRSRRQKRSRKRSERASSPQQPAQSPFLPRSVPESPAAPSDRRGAKPASHSADTKITQPIPLPVRGHRAQRAEDQSSAVVSTADRAGGVSATAVRQAEAPDAVEGAASVDRSSGGSFDGGPGRSTARAVAAARRKAERAEMRRFTKTSRHRRAVRLSVFGVLLALVLATVLAVFSPVFAVREIRVLGAERIDPTLVQQALAGQLNTPLPLLNSGEIQRVLQEFPLIESYVTESELPNTLVVRIVERKPIAVVAAASGFQLVDAAGVPIEELAEPPAGFPEVELDADGVEGDSFDAAVRVLRSLSPDFVARVESVRAVTLDDVTLQMRDSPQRVIWGSAEESELKARVVEALMAQHAPSAAIEFNVSSPHSPIYRVLG